MTNSNNSSGLGDIAGGLSYDHNLQLSNTYGITHPLHRLLLTANGNLQRLVASYYDAPVSVTVLSQYQPRDTVWHRVVTLSVHGTVFCTARSTILIHDATCQELVASQRVGLGQLFRYLNLLPEFALLAAAPHSNGFWRHYTLSCAELTCDIVEEFEDNVWELCPNGTSGDCDS